MWFILFFYNNNKNKKGTGAVIKKQKLTLNLYKACDVRAIFPI